MHKALHYGILGGTFDPPHIGHLALAQEAFAQLSLDLVWFVPTGDPPHKPGRPISPAVDRLAMTRLAVAPDKRFAVSEVELTLPGPSYTVHTLSVLRQTWDPKVEITLILGWDMLLYLPQWRDPNGIVAAVDRCAAGRRPNYPVESASIDGVVAQVPGLRDKLTILSGPLLDISASNLRVRVASGLPIRYFVSDAVRSYIQEHHLYATQTPPAAEG